MIYKNTGYLSCSQAAKQIGITRQGLMRAVRENRIDGYKINRLWVFRIPEVENFRLKRKYK